MFCNATTYLQEDTTDSDSADESAAAPHQFKFVFTVQLSKICYFFSVTGGTHVKSVPADNAFTNIAQRVICVSKEGVG